MNTLMKRFTAIIFLSLFALISTSAMAQQIGTGQSSTTTSSSSTSSSSTLWDWLLTQLGG